MVRRWTPPVMRSRISLPWVLRWRQAMRLWYLGLLTLGQSLVVVKFLDPLSVLYGWNNEKLLKFLFEG